MGRLGDGKRNNLLGWPILFISSIVWNFGSERFLFIQNTNYKLGPPVGKLFVFRSHKD